MSDLLYGTLTKVDMTPDGKFKVGDIVQTTGRAVAHGMRDEKFIIAEIQMDAAGCVLLIEPGGYGYGEYYCEHAV